MRSVLSILALLASSATLADESPRIEQSREIVSRFQQQLGGRLKETLTNEGPVAAIQVCQAEAPEIAARMSREAGADVGRTALSLRNGLNAPDREQVAVMEAFQQDLAANPGQVPERFETRTDGSSLYMRGIVTEARCLLCHGPSPAPEIQAALQRHYPDDEATGFSLGQLRGAFVVEWPDSSEVTR